mmetsp:Transcript_12522/g.18377  ORF Transcript_12522/g.18377 Transcript_12522/m.18377 type:complete len:351 (-) Transcript_12522:632-1684(-)
MDPNNSRDRTIICSFKQFSALDEEMMMHILSFIADAPLEFTDASSRGTITGVLPFVNKKINEFCKRDYFWRAALKRVCVNEPSLWKEGLMQLLPEGTKSTEGLVDYARKEIPGSTYRSIFQSIFETHIRFTGRKFREVVATYVSFDSHLTFILSVPCLVGLSAVFYMRGMVRLGQAFGLHFFEPRYRLLIAEVMRDWPESARRGELIAASTQRRLPTFIYAHMSPLAPATPACLVQVHSCMIHPDGSADVMLTPVAYVSLERVWERSNSGRLFQATCLRMGQSQSRQIESQQINDVMENEFHQFAVNGEGILNIRSRGALNAIISHLVAAQEQDEEQDEIDNMIFLEGDG